MASLMKCNKRLIVVSDVPTTPVRAGNSACIESYCQLLEQFGFDVNFCFLSWPCPAREQIERAMQCRWGQRLMIYRPSFFERVVKKLEKELSVRVLGFTLSDHGCPGGFVRMVRHLQGDISPVATIANYWWLTAVFDRNSSVRRILYAHDVFANRLQRTGYHWMSTTPKIETKSLRRADWVLAIQDKEAEYFRGQVGLRVLATYCPLSIVRFKWEASGNIVLFFSGPNPLNVDGLFWFLEKVWPLCLQANDRFRLYIGGGICPRISTIQLGESVRVLGSYEKAEDFYKLGNVAINPCRGGSGLKIKSLEALAHGLPLVSHPHNIEGLPELDGAPIYCAESPLEFARILVSVNDQSAGGAFQLSARSYVEKVNQMCRDAFLKAVTA